MFIKDKRHFAGSQRADGGRWRGGPIVWVVLVSVVFLGGCASQSGARKEKELGSELDRVRHENVVARRTIQALEDRLLVLEDKLETAEIAQARRPDGGVPRLPVVRKLGPQGASAGHDEPGQVPLEQGEVPPLHSEYPGAALYDENIEIVYEDEAADTSKPRPTLTLRGTASSSSTPSAPRPVRSTPRAERVAVDDSGLGQGLEPLDVVPLPDAGIPARRTANAAPNTRPSDATQASAAGKSSAETRGEGPLEVYKRAMVELEARDHFAAMAGFRDFIHRWPGHDYADNAQYWLAEALYDQKDWGGALSAFRQVVERYPAGNKAPDALLKAGYCYLRLGEPQTGQEVLAQVVSIYPKTNAARLATARLNELAPANGR